LVVAMSVPSLPCATVKRPGVGLTGHKRGAACDRPRLSTVATRRLAKLSSCSMDSTARWPNSSVIAAERIASASAAEAATAAASPASAEPMG
jgi:hypothetical protein